MNSTSRCASCESSAPVTPPATPMGRRAFLAQSAVLAAMAALAACGGAGSDVTAPGLSGMTTLKVADYPTLASVGGVALLSIASSPFAVVRTSATTFVTLSRICPHQGTTVNESTSGFLCPNHGAMFSSTGGWVGGQPTSNMTSYPTSFDSTAGTITIG